MINEHHNSEYDAAAPAGIPDAVGDRYYAQDLFRDYYYLMDRLGMTIGDLADQTKFIISGGQVEQVASTDFVKIYATVAYIKKQVQVPNNFASLPPSTQNEDVEFIRVNCPLIASTAAPNAGATTYYVKLTYTELDGATRARAKKAGTYAYEQSPSYTITIDAVAPTAYDVVLAIYTGNGTGTLMTFKTTDGTYFSTSNLSLAHGWKRNYIINPDFDIWQRNTSIGLTIAQGYTSDRWFCEATTGLTTFSRQSFALGQVNVPNEPSYFMRLTTAVVGNITNVFQRIESVKSLAGKGVYLSFYAKSDVPYTFNVTSYQNFGTGGAPSGQVFATIATITLGTQWKKYEILFTFSSISGKTLGTNGDDYIAIRFFNINPTGASNVDIAQVQLNESPLGKPVPFESRSLETELALCQRYYSKSYDVDTAPASADILGQSYIAIGAVNDAGHVITLFSKYPVVMRTTPTLASYDDLGAGGTGGAMRCTMIAHNTVATAVSIGESGFSLSGTAGASVNRILRYQWTADAEL